ncbi:unnamed protein product [Polarella glacialis]|uniref:Apple domain-containing protein n=1 Tax=Polarella glacialis TaxID=89957 RepID=A0A813IP02_POLGL|nr:unnamed protein product [Polarella glacialis]
MAAATHAWRALVLHVHVLAQVGIPGTVGAEEPPRALEGHHIELLPELLGVVTRPPKLLEARAKAETEKTTDAVCYFAILGVLDNLARATFGIRAIANNCPQASNDAASHMPGEEISIKQEDCLISVAGLFASLALIVRGLIVAVSTCGEAAKIEELCGAAVTSILLPVPFFISSATVISAACTDEAQNLQPRLDYVQAARRLKQTERKVDGWQNARCVFHAISAARALAAIGFGLDQAVSGCPVRRTYQLQETVSVAGCTLDIAGTISASLRFVSYITLAVQDCTPEVQLDARCLGGVSGLVGGCVTTVSSGAAIYLACVVGDKKGDIISGKYATLFTSTSTGNSSAGTLNRTASGHSSTRRRHRRHLRERLQESAGFAESDELWLSMGYNMSDSQAPWLTSQEGPEMQELLEKGRKMIKMMQTSRQEVVQQAALQEYVEPEVTGTPRVPINSANTSDTLACSEDGLQFQQLGMLGHPMTVVGNEAVCQARCARIIGCMGYAFWRQDRHCHMIGFLALRNTADSSGSYGNRSKAQGNWGKLWVSGPPGCREGQVSEATALLAERHRFCYDAHAIYLPSMKDPKPAEVPSALHCQRHCQRVAGCSHFAYSSLDGTCHLAGAAARKVQPVLDFVAGPRHCSGASTSEAETDPQVVESQWPWRAALALALAFALASSWGLRLRSTLGSLGTRRWAYESCDGKAVVVAEAADGSKVGQSLFKSPCR